METTYALNENENLQEIKRPPRIGFIKTFAGTTPPEGTLLCDGSAVSRDTYSELFAAIGTTWGEGDGSTTFNLPDLRDQWILCAGTEHGAGDAVAEGLPNLTGDIHTLFNDGTGALVFNEIAVSGVFSCENSRTETPSSLFLSRQNAGTNTPSGLITDDNSGNTIYMDANRASSIYGASTHVTPASVAVLPCIVYE